MTDTTSQPLLSDYAEEPCGHTLTGLGAMPLICLRRIGHDDEHISMFGNVSNTVVVHWGHLNDMVAEMEHLQGKGLR